MFQILAIDAFRPLGLISIALKNLSKIWSSELGTYCLKLYHLYQTLERVFIKFETHVKSKKCWIPR